MGYLLIGVAVGLLVNRYIFPILDMLLDQLQYKITKVCTAIQIDTNLMSLEFEELVNSRNELTPAIGFVAGGSHEDYEYEEEEEENKNKIGFRNS